MNNNHIPQNPFDQIKEQKQINFEIQKYKEEKRRSWIQFWVPTVISLLALFRPELFSLIKVLIGLCSNK